ncbi:MAG: Trm112 family protein [Anaerolineae bacterium]|nr:Trm112 family protein [Anaerolineae bacterium]
MSTPTDMPISPELLEILRCPLAVQSSEYGDDPGRLRLVHNSWLVCDDNNLKYPIRDGIPVMLIEEGKKWQQIAEADLPVPPPPA